MKPDSMSQILAEEYVRLAESDALRMDSNDKSRQGLPTEVAVVGTGTMGAGIAMVCADAGIKVVLIGRTEGSCARARAAIEHTYQSAVSKRRISETEAAKTVGRIQLSTRYSHIANANLVVEAITEDAEAKAAVIGAICGATCSECIVASTTSSIDIDELANASSRPGLVVGMHFFSPVRQSKLVEVVQGRGTAEQVVQGARAMAAQLGKCAVVVRNGVGFVSNRMLAYYRRESSLMVEEGARVPDIDRVMVGFGMPMGPFAMQDLAGLDIEVSIRRYLASKGLRRSDGPQSDMLERLYGMGRFGQKTGAGWYRYAAGSRAPIEDSIVDALACDAAERRGIARRSIPDEEIIGRIMAALANEGARIVEEGIAQSAAAVDVIMCNAFGFPRGLGGPMYFADITGVDTIVQRIDSYRMRLGSHWNAATSLLQAASNGTRLSDLKVPVERT